MSSRDLLPYPLAGADDGAPEPVQLSSPPAGSGRRSTLALVLLIVVLAVSCGILGVAQHRNTARITVLQAQLTDALAAAQRNSAAADAAIAAPITAQQAFGPEMTVASAGVERFLEQPRGTEASRREVFVAAFFEVPIETSAWIRVAGRFGGLTGVLARVDDPAEPHVVWVSRRSFATVDPSIPALSSCLRLDVDAVLTSAQVQRTWPRVADFAPLRWWPDVYRFVPPEECGPRR